MAVTSIAWTRWRAGAQLAAVALVSLCGSGSSTPHPTARSCPGPSVARPERVVPLMGEGEVSSVAFTLDHKLLVGGTGGVLEEAGQVIPSSREVILWNAQTGAMQRRLIGHGERVDAVAFSPGGTTVASGSWDTTVKLWDARTAMLKRTLIGHSGYVHCVAFSPNGKRMASGSGDRTVKLWDAASGRLERTLVGH